MTDHTQQDLMMQLHERDRWIAEKDATIARLTRILNIIADLEPETMDSWGTPRFTVNQTNQIGNLTVNYRSDEGLQGVREVVNPRDDFVLSYVLTPQMAAKRKEGEEAMANIRKLITLHGRNHHIVASEVITLNEIIEEGEALGLPEYQNVAPLPVPRCTAHENCPNEEKP